MLVLGVGSLCGLVMFLWPLVISPPTGSAHSTDLPFGFVFILLLVIGVPLAEVGRSASTRRRSPYSGCPPASVRYGAGTAGLETVSFLLILAGRMYGVAFGFVLGCTTLFASALLTGGVGPWLPFRMLAAAWIGAGAGAGALPSGLGRLEVPLLFMPFAVGTFSGGEGVGAPSCPDRFPADGPSISAADGLQQRWNRSSRPSVTPRTGRSIDSHR